MIQRHGVFFMRRPAYGNQLLAQRTGLEFPAKITGNNSHKRLCWQNRLHSALPPRPKDFVT